MADSSADSRPHPLQEDAQRRKLPRLPPTARITKRPLLRPAIPSPHAGSSQPKVVYVSSRTAFIPVIKRVEKLLHLADKRTTQSATTLTQNNRKNNTGLGKRKRGKEDNGPGDELLEIARTAEKQRKEGGNGGEEVVIRGTGKAVEKVLEFALWFQQREDRFRVELRTGSVAAIDDIEVNEADEVNEAREDGNGGEQGEDGGVEFEGGGVVGGVDDTTMGGGNEGGTSAKKRVIQSAKNWAGISDEVDSAAIPETRMRYTSSLEVIVSLI